MQAKKKSRPITTQQDVARLGTILTVWAHPDDETFCAGGLLAAAIRNGQRVMCVTATRGESGSQDTKKWPSSHMGGVRAAELQAALKILGITEHRWLNYVDGECHKADIQRAANDIVACIQECNPDTILTFGPEGLTGHLDHAAVSQWVDAAIENLDHKPTVYHAVVTANQFKNYLQAADEALNMFFNIDQPPLFVDDECDICFNCTNELCRSKQDAFAAMPSQFEKMHAAFDKQYLSEAFRVEAFIRAGDTNEE